MRKAHISGATLSTGQTVFAKLWDGWKFSRDNCDRETNVYFHLRDLWGTTVPDFLGSGNWEFCHVLLLSYIDVFPPLEDSPCPPHLGPVCYFFSSCWRVLT